MTRPTFGKMRTVVLPATPQAPTTLDGYREETGIDLLDVFDIILGEDGYIQVYVKENTLVLFQSALLDEDDRPLGSCGLLPANDRPQQDAWISGSSNAITGVRYTISDGNGGTLTSGGLSFYLSRNAEFKLENILVSFAY